MTSLPYNRFCKCCTRAKMFRNRNDNTHEIASDKACSCAAHSVCKTSYAHWPCSQYALHIHHTQALCQRSSKNLCIQPNVLTTSPLTRGHVVLVWTKWAHAFHETFCAFPCIHNASCSLDCECYDLRPIMPCVLCAVFNSGHSIPILMDAKLTRCPYAVQCQHMLKRRPWYKLTISHPPQCPSYPMNSSRMLNPTIYNFLIILNTHSAVTFPFNMQEKHQILT